MRIHIIRWMIFLTIAGIILPMGQAGAVVLKIATLSPEGSFWMKNMREGAREVEQKTNKRVRFKFYPGGVMGGDNAVLQKIRIGQLHGGAIVAGSLAKFYNDNQVYTLPMKFKNFEEVGYVRERMDPTIKAGLEKGGFVPLGMAGGGFAYIMSQSPIRTVDDLRKQKVWIPNNNATMLKAVDAFGIKPIPLSVPDVRAGLQTGLIDTITTPPIGAVILQWHTQVKYLTDIPFIYVYAIFALDKRAFSKIPPGDQSIVKEVIGKTFQQIETRNYEDNFKAMEALKKQGIQFVKPPPEAMGEWYKRSSNVPKRLVKMGNMSQKIVDTLDGHLKGYRSK